jgi:hypothetical protein
LIDCGIPKEWPPEVVAAVKNFEQGHLIERPPFAAFWAVPRYQVWQEPEGEQADGEGEPSQEPPSNGVEEENDVSPGLFTADG